MSTKSDISPGNDHDTLVTQKSETVRSIRNNHKEKKPRLLKIKKPYLFLVTAYSSMLKVEIIQECRKKTWSLC